MSDFMLAFMFLTMVVSPCIAARLICTSKDHSPVLLSDPDAEYS